MHMIDLICSSLESSQKEKIPTDTKLGICCVTGHETDTIPAKKLLGSNFMDKNLLIAPDSNRVGVNVWYVFQFGYLTNPTNKRKKKPEFMSCWWCDGTKFLEITKSEIRNLVLNGTNATMWGGWVTTSYKKHGSLRSPINKSRYGFWGFDDLVVDASNIVKVLDIWKQLRKMQTIGIGRIAIETLDISVVTMLKAGIHECNEFKIWAENLYRSPLYKLLVYLLPSQQELKDGYTDEILYD